MNKENLNIQLEIATLTQLPVFEGYSEKKVEAILSSIDYSLQSIPKGTVVALQNSICTHLYLLLEGRLEVHIVDICGNNIKIEDIVGPREFATPHLFDRNNKFPATFSAKSDSLLLKIPKNFVFDLFAIEPAFLKNFLQVMGACNACTACRLRILSFKNIRSRFVYYLLDRKTDDNVSYLGHNQTQLAEYIGVSRPALAKEIKKMIDEKLIEICDKKVKLLAFPSLLQYV